MTTNLTPAETLRSSGDLIADRRFTYAQDLAKEGEWAAAAGLLAQILELVPTWPAAWFKLGEIEAARGDEAASAAAFATALALDSRDELGAGLHLARLGAAAAPQSAPEAYVRTLFDHYAARFDAHLLGELRYRAPPLLAAAVQSLGAKTFAQAIDLGCGTGLAGAAFRGMARRLAGIDLSAGMIAAARVKGIYDRLEVASIDAFLATEPAASADLLIAADVLCYVGDLAPAMRGASRVLMPGGLFALTLQKGQGSQGRQEGYAIGPDLRFAHAPDYVRETAAAQGLATARIEEAPLRRDAGAEVLGLVVLLRKT